MAMALDPDLVRHLADVRERQALRRVEDLDGASGDPSVAAVGGAMGGRDVLPGRHRGVEEAGLVVLDRERDFSAAPVHVVRGGTLRVECRPSPRPRPGSGHQARG